MCSGTKAIEIKKRPRSAALGRPASAEDVEDEDLCVRVTFDDRVEFVFGDHHVGGPVLFEYRYFK